MKPEPSGLELVGLELVETETVRWKVICDETNNPPEKVESGTINITLVPIVRTDYLVITVVRENTPLNWGFQVNDVY